MPYQSNMSHGTGSTAFLTHAPFTSADMGSRPKSMMDRSRTFLDPREGFNLSPFLFRRSTTNYGELPPLNNAPTRTKSAKQGTCESLIMPRSHVSVARFYDWSEDLGDCFSVSKLYREIAKIPRGSTEKMSRFSSHASSSGSIHLAPVSLNSSRQYSINPGRMFVRDKKALTRGEREIIEGIYKNRGDVSSRDAVAKSEFQVKSHQDAWYVGKPPCDGPAFGKTLLKGERLDGKLTRSCCHLDTERTLTPSVGEISRNEDTAFLKPSNSTETLNSISRSTGHRLKPPNEINPCSTCQAQRDTQDIIKRALRVQNQNGYWDESPSAPPSTPDNFDKRPLTQQPPTFDKLLGGRSSLPPNSILLAEKIRVYNGNSSQSNTLQNGDPKPTTAKTTTINTDNDSTLVSKTQNGSCDILTLTNEEHLPQTNIWGSDSESQLCDEDSDDSDPYKRKFRVKVVVPTAEPDHIEDDLSIVESTGRLSLAKERPLSHTEFKGRNSKRSYEDQEQSTPTKQSERQPLEVN